MINVSNKIKRRGLFGSRAEIDFEGEKIRSNIPFNRGKQVDEITYSKYPDGTYQFSGNKNDNQIFNYQRIPENKLEENGVHDCPAGKYHGGHGSGHRQEAPV